MKYFLVTPNLNDLPHSREILKHSTTKILLFYQNGDFLICSWHAEEIRWETVLFCIINLSQWS